MQKHKTEKNINRAHSDIVSKVESLGKKPNKKITKKEETSHE